MVPILIFLLWLCVYALVIYVVIYFFIAIVSLFIAIPPKIEKLIYLVGALLLLLYLVEGLPGIVPPPLIFRK